MSVTQDYKILKLTSAELRAVDLALSARIVRMRDLQMGVDKGSIAWNSLERHAGIATAALAKVQA
jgi:hypothetical protein